MIKSGTNFSLFLKHFGKFPYYTYYETLELTYLKSYNNMDITISQNLFNDKVKLIVGAKNLFNVIEISRTTANSRFRMVPAMPFLLLQGGEEHFL
ncbi:MAG: hypothetical protein R2771_00560 [Saprospiraceae bacterium]